MAGVPNKTLEEKKAFATAIVDGVKPRAAYTLATGVEGKSASEQAYRWKKMPEIQKLIQMETHEKLVKAGVLSVTKLLAGLDNIEPTKMTPTDVKLINMGLTMSGILDKKIEVSVTDTQTLDPEVEAALKLLGQEAIKAVHDLKQDADGTYKVIDDPELSAEPDPD